MSDMPQPSPPIAVIRLMFGLYMCVIPILGVVSVLVGGNGDAQPLVFGVAIVAIAVAGPVLTRAAPDLSCRNPDTLVTSYRARFFVRLAVAEAPVMVGVVAALVTDSWWIYLVGAVAAVPGFARAAPTRGRLIRDQQHLQLSGCAHDLLEVLGARPADPIG